MAFRLTLTGPLLSVALNKEQRCVAVVLAGIRNAALLLVQATAYVAFGH